MPFGGLLTAGLISGGSSILSGIFGGKAATAAAGQQSAAAQKGIDFTQGVWNQEQQNEAPFLQGGQASMGQLMEMLKMGTLGPGSIAAPGAFTAPTLEQARRSPGYQFSAQQGSKGILQGAAAAGGAISGGTLKALDTFNTGLADQTYGDVFNRAMGTYQAGLQRYQAQLQGQQQGFQQLLAPISIGQTAAGSLNQAGSEAARGISDLFTGMGNAQAAGTVGSSNALWGGITGAANDLMSSVLYNKLFSRPQGGGSAVGSPTRAFMPPPDRPLASTDIGQAPFISMPTQPFSWMQNGLVPGTMPKVPG